MLEQRCAYSTSISWSLNPMPLPILVSSYTFFSKSRTMEEYLFIDLGILGFLVHEKSLQEALYK